MSGPKEESLTPADESVEPAAAPEAPDDLSEREVAASQEPDGDAEPRVEMTAAEALARATEEAAEPVAEPAAQAEPAVHTEPTEPSAPAEPAEVTVRPEPTEPSAQAEPSEPAVQAEPSEPSAQADPAEPAVQAEPAENADSELAATPEPDAAMSAATDDSEAAPQPEEETEQSASAAGDQQPEAARVQAEPSPTSGETTETAEEAAAAPSEAPASDETESTASEAPAAAEKPAPAKAQKTPPPDRPELLPILEALENRQPVEGRVIGWNNGGFHLALGELSAFCPRSEMEVGEIQEPESYLDQVFMFRVLRLQGKGRRIVVSRAAHLRKENSRQRNQLRKKLQPGTVLDGTVASLKDFGAFVDLGGAQGLVHVSEISHRRVEHPSHVLSEGQEIKVKVLKVEQGGRRISLSIRALEPDPWKDLADRFPRGAVVKGTVERANQIGAFIELAPGLTGLLPARSMSIPRETSPARAYPPGKQVSVQIVSVDPRRQRISLALEGSGLEGSTSDYKEYQRQRREEEGEGFNALASAFRRLRDD